MSYVKTCKIIKTQNVLTCEKDLVRNTLSRSPMQLSLQNEVPKFRLSGDRNKQIIEIRYENIQLCDRSCPFSPVQINDESHF